MGMADKLLQVRRMKMGRLTISCLALAGLVWWAAQPEYRVLYVGLAAEEAGAITSKLQAKGIPFVMPPTQREGEGIKLTVCLDPDGLPISFAQMIAQGAAK